MNTAGWLQLGLYVVVLLLLAKPLGSYMAAVYEGRALRSQRIAGPLERLIYRGAGVDPSRVLIGHLILDRQTETEHRSARRDGCSPQTPGPDT